MRNSGVERKYERVAMAETDREVSKVFWMRRVGVPEATREQITVRSTVL